MQLKRRIGSKKISQLLDNEKERADLGFGTKITEGSRLINKDGTFNTQRVNVSFAARINLFHRLTTMSWRSFFAVVFCIYFIINCIFSGIYLMIGTEYLQGIKANTVSEQFWSTFFFSAQTLTTVGYGHIAPVGHLASAVAAIEALIGLLGFALATGLMYGRFSRPRPMLLFSRNAIFAPYLDINGWMFRVINQSRNELIDVTVEITMSRLETGTNGLRGRKYYPIDLERNRVVFFPMSWTLVHPITEKSPLFGLSPEDLRASDVEFLISVKATEETFLQPTQTRYSYTYEELIWGAKFRQMFDSTQKVAVTKLDVQKLHDYDEAELN
jgi:inward rectifier potassium channel